MTNSRPPPANVRQGGRGQVGPAVVAVHQHRPGDPQPPVLARPDGHPVERHPVVHAPAAGLAHAVGGDRAHAGRARLVEHAPRRPLPRRPARTGSGRAPRPRPARRAAAPAAWGRPTRARTRRPRRRARRGAVASAATAGSVSPTTDRVSTCSPATCEAGRHASHRSPGRAPARASDARAEWPSAAALSSTPLGSPVDPEVPMMTAVSAATPGAPERVRASPPAPVTVSRLEGVEQLPDPRGGQGRVDGQDRGPAAVQRPGQRLEQPGGVGGAAQQHRLQGAAVRAGDGPGARSRRLRLDAGQREVTSEAVGAAQPGAARRLSAAEPQRGRDGVTRPRSGEGSSVFRGAFSVRCAREPRRCGRRAMS